MNIEKAIALWNGGQERIFDFAVECAGVIGRYQDGATDAIAKRIKRSRSTVENYARAGRLWLILLDDDPAKCELIRDSLSVSFWLPIARLYEQDIIRVEGVWHWFDETIKAGWTVEEMRSHLPNKQAKSTWVKDARWIIGLIETRLLDSPALDVDEQEYGRANKILRAAIRIIRRAIGESGEPSHADGRD